MVYTELGQLVELHPDFEEVWGSSLSARDVVVGSEAFLPALSLTSLEKRRGGGGLLSPKVSMTVEITMVTHVLHLGRKYTKLGLHAEKKPSTP